MPRTAPTAVMERGIKPPVRESVTQHGKKISLTESIKALTPGASFRIDQPRHRNMVYVIAKRVGVKVTTFKKDEMLFVALK